MNKRQFSSQKIYKLLKIVVLAITILAVVIVTISIAMWGIYELFREQSGYVFGNNYNYTHRIDPEAWSLTLSRQTNEIIEIALKWLVIAIAVIKTPWVNAVHAAQTALKHNIEEIFKPEKILYQN